MIRNQQYQSYIQLVSEELKENVKSYEKTVMISDASGMIGTVIIDVCFI